MKYALIAAAALSMLAAPAMADNKVDECTAIAAVGKLSMEMRQTGAALPTVVGALSKELDGEKLAVAVEVLQLAYSEPLYSTDRAKQEAANEFSSKMFLACMEVEA